MKRFLMVAGLVVLMLAGGPGASGAEGADDEVVAADLGDVSETAGRDHGQGHRTETAVDTQITDPATGIVTVVNYTKTTGVATDNKGGRYTFDYRNSFHVQNSAAAPATYIGTMFDLFSLTGRGPSSLRNGFVAMFTTDLASSFSFQRLLAWGDPIAFPSGAAHCDPL